MKSPQHVLIGAGLVARFLRRSRAINARSAWAASISAAQVSARCFAACSRLALRRAGRLGLSKPPSAGARRSPKGSYRTLACAIAGLAVALVTVATAQTSDLTRITRVIQHPQPAAAGSSFVNPHSPRRLPKFTGDTSSGAVRFDVEWQASSAGVPPGASVFLDYRLPKSLQTGP